MRPFPNYSGGTAWDLHPTSLLNPDTRRAKGYLRVHYSTILISFQAEIFDKPIALLRLDKSIKCIYNGENPCYNACIKQNTWEFTGVRTMCTGEKGTE